MPGFILPPPHPSVKERLPQGVIVPSDIDLHCHSLCQCAKHRTTVEMAERSKAAASGAVPPRRARVRTSLSIKSLNGRKVGGAHIFIYGHREKKMFLYGRREKKMFLISFSAKVFFDN